LRQPGEGKRDHPTLKKKRDASREGRKTPFTSGSPHQSKVMRAERGGPQGEEVRLKKRSLQGENTWKKDGGKCLKSGLKRVGMGQERFFYRIPEGGPLKGGGVRQRRGGKR